MSTIRNQQLLAKIHAGEDSQTQFKSDVTNQFKVTIFRSSDPKAGDLTQKEGQNDAGDPKKDLLTSLKNDPRSSYTNLAERLNVSDSTIKRLIQKLKHQGKIRRIGSKRGGAWEVLS